MRLAHDNCDPQLRKWTAMRITVWNACVSRLAIGTRTAELYVNLHQVCWKTACSFGPSAT